MDDGKKKKKKQLSGAQKRKKKKEKEAAVMEAVKEAIAEMERIKFGPVSGRLKSCLVCLWLFTCD